jgi:hypothetical protein
MTSYIYRRGDAWFASWKNTSTGWRVHRQLLAKTREEAHAFALEVERAAERVRFGQDSFVEAVRAWQGASKGQQ